jgi:hypothetical protein
VPGDAIDYELYIAVNISGLYYRLSSGQTARNPGVEQRIHDFVAKSKCALQPQELFKRLFFRLREPVHLWYFLEYLYVLQQN